jgi:hypothetical protein
METLVMSPISYTGFLLVPLGHGSVIQPSCATLGGLFLAAVVVGERMSFTRLRVTRSTTSPRTGIPTHEASDPPDDVGI